MNIDIEAIAAKASDLNTGITQQRKYLAEAIDGGADIQRINGLLLSIAHSTGTMDVYAWIPGTFERGGIEAVRHSLMRTATNGADDAWSGRGNDVKRAYDDGKLAAIRAVMNL